MLQDEILVDINSIGKDKGLYSAKNFSLRSQAIDFIDFHILDRLNALAQTGIIFDDLHQLAQKLRQELENVNVIMFRKLRAEISRIHYTANPLVGIIEEYLKYDLNEALLQQGNGYDDLDVFVNGLLMHRDLPTETLPLKPGMVFYQKTPARIVLHMLRSVEFKPGDIFFDIGSGLGQVCILVSMLTGVSSAGIEFEPDFCRYAKACAADLSLDHADFINVDARDASYATGTVFFMYTPFHGQMFRDVMGLLHCEAKRRTIKLFTYGPCTREVAKLDWLKSTDSAESSVFEFGEFISIA